MYRDQVPKEVQEYVKAQNPGEDPEVEQQDSKTVKRQRPGQKHDAVVLNPMEQTLQM